MQAIAASATPVTIRHATPHWPYAEVERLARRVRANLDAVDGIGAYKVGPEDTDGPPRKFWAAPRDLAELRTLTIRANGFMERDELRAACRKALDDALAGFLAN